MVYRSAILASTAPGSTIRFPVLEDRDFAMLGVQSTPQGLRASFMNTDQGEDITVRALDIRFPQDQRLFAGFLVRITTFFLNTPFQGYRNIRKILARNPLTVWTDELNTIATIIARIACQRNVHDYTIGVRPINDGPGRLSVPLFSLCI